MKKIIFIFFFSFYSCITLASHITGGEMTYEYLGPGTQANTRSYKITLKLFRDHYTTGAPMPSEVYIGIYDNDNGKEYNEAYEPHQVLISELDTVKINAYPPCVINATQLKYDVGNFSFTVELPVNKTGYTASYQTCCRVTPLNNVFTTNGTGGTGSTYACVIPVIIDTSPSFASSIDLICQNRDFTLNFSASDKDGDSLVYAFVDAYNGGNAQNAININPAAPPYFPVTYLSDYSGETPLGNSATINPLTGVISGIAPVAGKYVVCVQVTSYKNKTRVGTHTKDFIINVGDCDVPGAMLKPKPVSCSGYSVSFSNDNPSALNKTVFWDFGDPKSGALDTSTSQNPLHEFSDTGVFVYKLIVNRGEPCSDSTTQIVRIYPGFSPGFLATGQCKNTPISFTDTTISKFGIVNSRLWNFADPQQANDTSHLKNPTYVFSTSADYKVQLIVGDTRGCVDTATETVTVKDKPAFSIPHDTLICAIDTLQLPSSGIGTFFWTPAYNISNQNSSSPLVSPDIPTKYYANFSDAYGCKGSDSVFVDVKQFVTLNSGNDTTICSSDAILLHPVSDALQFKWAPSGSLDNEAIKYPVATPLSTTTYTLIASIGKCQNTDQVTVKVAPYPAANAGNDSSICLGTSIQLNASGGSFYRWSPAFFLNNSNISNPIANPISDISYNVTVSDTLGCPKSVSDSIRLRVINVIADAGPSDTSVVVDQPLQLNATGGEYYVWTPSAGLSDPAINNPIAVLNNSQQYVVQVNESGCFDTDTINIKVFKVAPGLYVPNAFTPNNDGLNDVLRPIPVGIKSISYFRVYNRWGRLMFSSSQIGKGWDGKFEGKPQDSAIYVWMIEGIDYRDKKFTQKGSVVLIR